MKNIFKSLGKALGGAAPTIATALGGAAGGPVGVAIARAATKALAKALGADLDSGPDRLEEALALATPEHLAAVRRADQAFAATMREHDLDELRIAAEDRASARQREVHTKDWMPGIVATCVMLGFFGILTAMIYVAIPDTAHDPLMIMLGALGTLVTQVGAYYFGFIGRVGPEDGAGRAVGQWADAWVIGTRAAPLT